MPILALSDYEDDLLARLYDAEYGGIDGDIGFYLEQLVPGAILELACGTGRLALALARRGRRVVGLDRSRAMLERAGHHPDAEQVEWILADMARFDLGYRFGNILIPFSGLCFLEKQGRADCLECCRRHLAPGGLLFVDLFNGTPGTTAASRQSERPVIDRRTGIRWMKSTAVAREDNAVEIRYTWQDEQHTLTQTLRLAILNRDQSEAELESAGFVALEVYGDYRGGAYTPRSPRLLILAGPLPIGQVEPGSPF